MDAENNETVPSSETLASSLVIRLRQAITSGELPPGSKLRLDALRERLGLLPSRGPLREALSRLGAEGLVLIEDQRGYRVAPVSEKNLSEVATLRVHFESLALRYAIAKGDRVWESEIIAALYRLCKVKRVDEAPPELQEEWERAHHEFHGVLISGCDMPLLISYCSTLHDLNDRYRRLFLSKNPFDRNVQDEHEKMAEATISRQADLACSLLEQHIQRTAVNIRDRLIGAKDDRKAAPRTADEVA
jgi:DNA-binding GntR family transcriptional regulator